MASVLDTAAIQQYFVLQGAIKYLKWSAHKKSLGTTVFSNTMLNVGRCFNRPTIYVYFAMNSTVYGCQKELPGPSDRCRLFQDVGGSQGSSSNFLEHTEIRK